MLHMKSTLHFYLLSGFKITVTHILYTFTGNTKDSLEGWLICQPLIQMT